MTIHRLTVRGIVLAVAICALSATLLTQGTISLGTIPASTGIVHQKTVTLTDAQIKALPEIPVPIVPAPGPDKILVFMTGILHGDYAAGAYTGIDANAFFWFAIGDDQLSITGTLEGLVAADDHVFQQLSPYFRLTSAIISQFETAQYSETDVETLANLPIDLRIDNGGQLMGGDPANTLTVSVAYLILDTTTGLFE